MKTDQERMVKMSAKRPSSKGLESLAQVPQALCSAWQTVFHM